MSKIFLFILILMTIFSFKTDKDKKIPGSDIYTLDGNKFNTLDFDNNGKPIVINFWATWCSPCVKELDNMSELYSTWQNETGVKVIAISIDDPRHANRIKPLVNSHEWEFEIYHDKNQDFKRALNVGIPPYTLLLDSNKNIVFEHSTYSEGDEVILYEKIKALVNK